MHEVIFSDKIKTLMCYTQLLVFDQWDITISQIMPVSSMLLTGLDKHWEDVNLEKLGNTVREPFSQYLCSQSCLSFNRAHERDWTNKGGLRVIFLVFSELTLSIFVVLHIVCSIRLIDIWQQHPWSFCPVFLLCHFDLCIVFSHLVLVVFVFPSTWFT